jgi:hypothetical protein
MSEDEYAEVYDAPVEGMNLGFTAVGTDPARVLEPDAYERYVELNEQWQRLDGEMDSAFTAGDIDRFEELDVEFAETLEELFEILQAFEEGDYELEDTTEEPPMPEEEREEFVAERDLESLEHVRVAHQLERLKASRLSDEAREALVPGTLVPNFDEELHPVIADTVELLRHGQPASRAMAIPLKAGLSPVLAFQVTREAERIAVEDY